MNFNYLQSERLIYRPLQIQDIDDFVKFRNEETYRKWFGFQPATTHEMAKNEIENMMGKGVKEINILKESLDAGLFLKTTGEFVGTVSLNKFHGPEEELEYVEVGFGVCEKHQNKGYATEAVITAVTWGLNKLKELGFEPKIEGIAEHGNIASSKVLERSGFIIDHDKEYVTVYVKTLSNAE